MTPSLTVGLTATESARTLLVLVMFRMSNLMMLKTAPCGSANTAKRPTFGMSVGGT